MQVLTAAGLGTRTRHSARRIGIQSAVEHLAGEVYLLVERRAAAVDQPAPVLTAPRSRAPLPARPSPGTPVASEGGNISAAKSIGVAALRVGCLGDSGWVGLVIWGGSADHLQQILDELALQFSWYHHGVGVRCRPRHLDTGAVVALIRRLSSRTCDCLAPTTSLHRLAPEEKGADRVPLVSDVRVRAGYPQNLSPTSSRQNNRSRQGTPARLMR